MTTKLPEIPFITFLSVTTVGHLIFAIPAIMGILLFNLMNVNSLFFIFIPIALISIPISAAFAWLIARGSNWVNTSAAITAVCSVPGRMYGIFFGGLLGSHFFNTAGGIVVATLFYFLALAATLPIGKLLSRKVIPIAK
jgi:hypothetical protein